MPQLTTGKPFITLDNIAIQERYFSSVPGWSDPDHALSAEQAADVVEWKAFVDGLVTDLIVRLSHDCAHAEPHNVLSPAQPPVPGWRADRGLPLPDEPLRAAPHPQHPPEPPPRGRAVGPRRRRGR